MENILTPTICKRLSSYDHRIVSVSGGPDSMCLLSILVEIAPIFGASVHVRSGHHGIRDDADKDINLVRQWCQIRGVEYTISYYEGEKSETAMRSWRKQSLQALQCTLHSSCILTGHHLDDRIETSLYRLRKGTGPLGYIGTTTSNISTLWPLAHLTKTQILHHCQLYTIPYRLDSTNTQASGGPRNRIRHVLVPLLRSQHGHHRWYQYRQQFYHAGDTRLQRLQSAYKIYPLPPSPHRESNPHCRGIRLTEGSHRTPSLSILALSERGIYQHHTQQGMQTLFDFISGNAGIRLDYGEHILWRLRQSIVITDNGNRWDRAHHPNQNIKPYRPTVPGDRWGSQSLTRRLQKQGVPHFWRSSAYVLEDDGEIVDCILPAEYIEWSKFLDRKGFSSLANYHGLDMATCSLPHCSVDTDHHAPTDEEKS